MGRQGSKVTHVKCDGVSFLEIKRLLPPGFSLSAFGRLTSVVEKKLIFNFDWLNSIEQLDRTSLPPDAADWVNRLTGTGPSQEEVNEALLFFQQQQFGDLWSYLSFYLKIDCILLAKATQTLFAGYFSLLGIHPLDSRRGSVSSLSFYASQMHLFAHKRIGQFFVNDPVAHSLIRQGTRGGITCVMRSFGGEKVDVGPFVDLYKRQKEWEEDASKRDPLAEAEEPPEGAAGKKHHSLPSDDQIATFLKACNSHIFASPEDPGGCLPATHCTYLDVNGKWQPQQQ
jgi:hypothetical protein